MATKRKLPHKAVASTTATTSPSQHSGSPLMLADIDAACTSAGLWPHAGCGGHNPLSPIRNVLRTPYVISPELTLNSFDATDYGYTRVIVDASTMTIEQHNESDGPTTKTPNDRVVIDLASYTIA